MEPTTSASRPKPPFELTLAWPQTLVTEIADALAERLGEVAPTPSRSPWLDVPGAAAYLTMTPEALRKAAKRGLLPAHQPFGPGSRYFFHRAELDEHILGRDRVRQTEAGRAP